jgi:hypothetical protein
VDECQEGVGVDVGPGFRRRRRQLALNAATRIMKNSSRLLE